MFDVRADAQSQITAALARGAGGPFVIVGEAGIGKSTLANGIVDHAREHGIAVVTTRWSGDAASPPMWAWSILFRNWASALGPLSALEEVHPFVRRLAPDVAEVAGLSTPDAPADELSSRILVGDALGRLFARATAPVLVVLEDLHHAPVGGLGLLASFAAAAVAGPVLILATTRPSDVAADLVALPSSVRVDLTPLGADAAVALVRSIDPSLDDRVVDAVVARAEGNPFFLSELARLRATTDDATTTPAVRDVVLQRVDGLGAGAREVLAIGALLGRKPEIDVVAAVVDDDEHTDAVIDDAERARLIEVDGPVFRFSHDLVRDALVESLRSREARRLHGRIADVLRAVPYADRFQLAHHLLESGAATVEVVDAGEAAALAAAAAGANEEAVHWADRTIAALGRLPDAPDRGRRLDLIAGRALVGLSEFVAGKERLVRSAAVALEAGDGPAGAVALLTIGAERLRNNPAYEPPMELMRRALALVEHEPHWRCRLIGRMSDLARDDSARALADEALAAARASGDADLIVTALGRILINWRDNDIAARRAAAAELGELATRASPEQSFEALACRTVVLLETGEFDEAVRLISLINAAVLRLGLPMALGFDWASALIALMQGRFDEADDIMSNLQTRVGAEHAFHTAQAQAIQRSIVASLRGEFGELLPTLEMTLQLVQGTPTESQVQCVRAFVAVQAGDLEMTRDAVDRVFSLGLDALKNLLFGLGEVFLLALAEATALLADKARVDELEPLVREFEGRMPVGAMAPVLAFGSADHVLALVAQSRGDVAAGRRHAATAVELHRRMHAHPFEARSLALAADLALVDGDIARAASDARAAAKLALRYGMQPTAEYAARVLAAAGAAPVHGASVGGVPTALVFTDIESSTQSAAALGDDAWMERLRGHDQAVRKLVAQHGGREVKHLGDGFMLTFPTASSAVDFARDLQTTFARGLLRVRAGVHVGPVVEEDGDIFGTTVNVAARVSAAAAGGETLISDAVLALVPTATDEPRFVALKGVEHAMQLHPLV